MPRTDIPVDPLRREEQERPQVRGLFPPSPSQPRTPVPSQPEQQQEASPPQELAFDSQPQLEPLPRGSRRPGARPEDISPEFLEQLARVESNFDPEAVSPAGAQGMFQFMPDTAQELEVDPFDPVQAADGAQRYMSMLLRRYAGDVDKALMAWNWGLGNVDRWVKEGKSPERVPQETRNFVAELSPHARKTLTTEQTGMRPTDRQAEQLLGQQGEDVGQWRGLFPLDIRDATADVRNNLLSGDTPQEFRKTQEDRDGTAFANAFDQRFNTRYPLGESMQQSKRPEDSPDERGEFSWTDPWLRGWQNLVAATGTTVDLVDYYGARVRSHANEFLGRDFSEEEYNSFMGSVAENLHQRAEGMHIDSDALPPIQDLGDLFDLRRAYETFAEGVPITAAFIGTFLVSRKAGAALIGGVYGGDALQRMKDFEEKTGEEIPQSYKSTAPVIVGSFSAALQRLGINQILRAAGVKGVRSKIFRSLIAAGTEGTVEAGQEITQTLAALPYEGEIPEETGQRLIEAFYGGAIVGLGSAGITSTIGAMTPEHKVDGTFIGVQRPEEGGQLQPMFRVDDPYSTHQGEQVTLDQANELGLRLPNFQRSLFKEQFRQEVPDSTAEIAEMGAKLIDIQASKAGMTTEEYLAKYPIGIEPSRMIQKGDIVQAPVVAEKLNQSNIYQQLKETADRWIREGHEWAQPFAEMIQRGEVDRGYAGLANIPQVWTSLPSKVRDRLKSYTEADQHKMLRPDVLQTLRQSFESKKVYKPDSFAFFNEEGGFVLSALNEGSSRGFVEAMGRHFAKMLTDSERQAAQEALGIPETWGRKGEDTFARAFEDFVRTGKTKNPRLKQGFQTYRDLMTEYWAKLIGRDESVKPISQEQADFFHKLVDQPDPVIPTEPVTDNRVWRPVQKLWRLFTDSVDIESRFSRIGADRTGRSIKNYYSMVESVSDDGIAMLQRVSKLLGGNQQAMKVALLAAESKEGIQAARESADPNMQKAIVEIRSWFDNLGDELHHRGVFDKRWKDEFIARKEQELAEADPTDRKKIEQLVEQLQEAEDIEFVHISRSLFDIISKNDPDRARNILKTLTDRRRRTPTLSTLLNDGVIGMEDINISDIVQAYASRAGKDIALMDIVRNAEAEGLATGLLESPTGGFVRPSGAAPVLRGYQVHPFIANWLEAATRRHQRSNIKDLMNTVKMYAFYNPLFLPMYDVLQSAMTGAISVAHPIRTMRSIRDGVNDVLNHTEEFQSASRDGIASKPFSMPFSEHSRGFRAAAESRGRIGLGQMKVIMEDAMQTRTWTQWGLAPLNLSKGMIQTTYQLSWDTTWFLDRMIRQITYRDGLQRGLTSQEASSRAALAHGDYASVPPETRSQLNKIFFTPTFKIAMGKFMLDSMKNMGAVVSGQADANMKQRAGTAMRTMGLLIAFDTVMRQALGMEQDEFGRSYYSQVDTELGPKELVISWSSPANLFLKYMQRIQNSAAIEVSNPLSHFFHSNRWELHPLWNIGREIVTNTGKDQQSIYDIHDSPEVKTFSILHYIFEETVQMAQALFGEDIGERGYERFREEYGQLTAMATKPFMFHYERQPAALRMQQTINRMVREFEEEVGMRNLDDKILRGQIDIEDLPEFFAKAEDRTKRFNNRLSEYIERMRREHFTQSAMTTPKSEPTMPTEPIERDIIDFSDFADDSEPLF